MRINLKTAVLSAFLLSALSCRSDSKECLFYYNNGAVLRRYNTIHDKIEGKMTEYYPDGKVMVERFFHQGIQTGRAVVFYESGKIKETQYFREGLQEKGDTIFYETGDPQFVVTYKDGKKDGYLRKWNPDGSLLFEALYELDKIKEVKGKKIEE